jgi:triosephosphate isomerase
MKKIIVANWKMNHGFNNIDEWLNDLFKDYADKYAEMKNSELVLCPPAIFLDYVDSELMEDGFNFLEKLAQKDGRDLGEFSTEEINEIVVNQRPIKLGAQDCHFAEKGSFTGDISAEMIRDLGCKYVIIGHSERRDAHGESNELLAKKLTAAVRASLTPIFCIGESKETRDAGQHLEFIEKQIMESLSTELEMDNLVIAYEPIWSIGTGTTPTVEQVSEMVEFIKKIIKEKFSNNIKDSAVLYGGSVTSANSGAILKVSNGLLVGKASLDAAEFIKIAHS